MKQPTTIPATPKPRKPRAKKTPAETTSAPETLLHIHLWTGDPSAPLHPLAAQMVSDLIRATAGDLQTCTDTAVSAAYPSTRQAIAAARSLCPLIDGFSTTTHAAFTLCYPGDLEHRDPSPTEPQRVLLIGTICAAARTIPGLRFRELPATANGATLELLTPPTPNLSSRPERSTSNLSSRPEAAHFAAAVERSQHSLPLAPTQNLSSRPKSAPFADAAERPASPPATAPNPKRRMQIFAATGAIALIALIAFFISRPSAKSQPAPAPAPTPVAAVTTPQPAPTPPVVATPKPPAEPRKQPPAEPRKQPPPPPKVKQPPPERETAPPPSASGVTFSPDEIKRMLATADKLSGDGNYDRAIALYDAVLRADRKNGAALEGRQRAVYNRDHR